MRTNPVFPILLACIFLSAECQEKSCPVPHSARNLVANSSWQDLTSPGFDTGRYPNNMDCKWILRAQTPEYVVKVVVQDSRLQDSYFCTFDYMTAYDGPSDSSTRLQKWCGTQTPTLNSTGQHLTLRFVTDSSIQESGFKLSFKEVPEGYRANIGVILGSIFGAVVFVLALMLGFAHLYDKLKKRRRARRSNTTTTTTPHSTTTTPSAPSSGNNRQVFYTTTNAPSLEQGTTTTTIPPFSPSPFDPTTDPNYSVGGFTYSQPYTSLTSPGRQESLPSEPPPSYWEATRWWGNSSASAAKD